MNRSHLWDRTHLWIYPYPKTSRKAGSALVVTLLVVSLLLAVALAFTAKVRLELRSVVQHHLQVSAQHNARLGLSLALARLQESAGPDARSTATAELLERDGAPLPPVTRQWVGVWKSPAGTVGAGHRRANAEWVSWLVSTDGSATPATYTPGLDAEGRPTSPDDILMVGPGSVGTGNAGDHVVVPLLTPDPNSRDSFAYWVSDENLKALANHVKATDGDAVMERGRTQAPDGIAVDLAVKDDGGNRMLTGASGIDRADAGQLATWNRSMNPGHSSFVFASATLNRALQRGFHDLTYASSGLQVNARDGGLKKDLGIAFEVDDADFHRSEFSQALSPLGIGSDSTNEWTMTNTGQSFQLKPVYSEPLQPGDGAEYVRLSNDSFRLDPIASLPATHVFRGPTWSQLRHHYRQYLELQNPFSDPEIAAVPSQPNPKTASRFENIAPIGHYFGKQKAGDLWRIKDDRGEAAVTDMHAYQTNPRPRFSSANRMPSLIRVTNYFSFKTGGPAPDVHTVTGRPGKELVLEHNAIVTLHNPYNTKLTVPGLYVSQFGSNQSLATRITNERSAGQGDLNFGLHFIYQAQPHVTSRGDHFDHMALVMTKNGNGSPEPIVFEPGEVKVFTAVDPAPTPPSPKGVIFLKEGVTANPLDDGFPLTHLKRIAFTPGGPSLFSSEPYYIYEGQTLNYSIGVTIENSWNPGAPQFGNHSRAEWIPLRYGLLDRDDIQRAFNNSVSKVDFDKKVFWEQMILIYTSRHLLGDPPRNVPTTYEQLDNGDGVYCYYVDMYRKPTTSSDGLVEWTDVPTELLAQSNSRAPVQRTEYGGGFGKDGTRLPFIWDAAMPLDANTDLGPLPNINRLSFNYSKGRAFWGNTLGSGGQDQLVLHEIPATPLLSLGALQHANIALYANEPEYIVGNGSAQADLPLDKLWLRGEITHHDTGGNGQFLYWFDTSYLINESLWDETFFSGAARPVNAAGTGFGGSVSDTLRGLPDGSTTLLNPRMRFTMPENTSPADYAEDTDLSRYATPESSQGDLRPHDTFARYLRGEGMFNVNSTSPAAWAAMLGSLRDANIAHYDDLDTPLQTTGLDGRSAIPKMALSGSDDGTGTREFYNGFLSLSDGEIEKLAEEIAKQVKLRAAVHGPFRSLGQFVNRWIADGTNGVNRDGVLGAAIRASALNEPFDADSEIAEEAVTDYFQTPGFIADTTHRDFPSPEVFNRSSAAEFGKYLTQGNLLTFLGPSLTVRGDTFRIRAYGDLRDSGGGTPLARAWCEAVVERETSYVDAAANHPATPAAGLSPGSINDRFGRRFRIVSFRWLSADEI